MYTPRTNKIKEKKEDYINLYNPIDWWILAIVLILTIFGLIMIYSASSVVADRTFDNKYFFFQRQFIFAIISLIAMWITIYLPRKLINSLHYIAIFIVFIMLFLCLTPLGNEVNGAKRWISLGSFSIQPLEFTKIALVLYLGYYMSEKRELQASYMIGFFPPFLVTMLFSALIMLQPDFGGTLILTILLFFMCLVGGSKFIYIFFTFLITGCIGLLFIITSPYRMERIFAFLDPFKDALDTGYQLVQSLYALGLGGFFGVGIGGSKQKILYLPESHNDFIMAIVGEEMGFFTISIIMLLFTLLFIRCFRVVLAQRSIRDRLTSFGISLVIAIGALFNLAVVFGSVPPTGVAMPFISYGGSSLLCSMICVGLILNYSRTMKDSIINE